MDIFFNGLKLEIVKNGCDIFLFFSYWLIMFKFFKKIVFLCLNIGRKVCLFLIILNGYFFGVNFCVFNWLIVWFCVFFSIIDWFWKGNIWEKWFFLFFNWYWWWFNFFYVLLKYCFLLLCMFWLMCNCLFLKWIWFVRKLEVIMLVCLG